MKEIILLRLLQVFSATKKWSVSFSNTATFDLHAYPQLCVWVQICMYISSLTGIKHDTVASSLFLTES